MEATKYAVSMVPISRKKVHSDDIIIKFLKLDGVWHRKLDCPHAKFNMSNTEET